ncbi:MAG: 50S ribosomal protein L29 [Deltaproteobacteria bacterium]
MLARELRSMSEAELKAKGEEMKREVGRLNMQRHARRLDKTTTLGKAKRDLARLLTVLEEKKYEGRKEGL